MDWLEQKYIGLVSNRLQRFKRTKKNEFNFRCPICGDSIRDKYKARGWFFLNKQGKYMYHCFNCTVSMGVDKFLENIDPVIYNEFLKEKLSEKLNPTEKPKSDVEEFAFKMKPPTFIKQTPLKELKKVSQLPFDHYVKQYVVARKIPTEYHAKLFWAPKFKAWTNSIVPDTYDDITFDEGRLIIPFIDKVGKLFGYQGRAIGNKSSIRYITIMIDRNMPKIFGIDNTDTSKTHFILEGPIDSMFIDNAIAMAGGSIDMNYVNENSVFVFDNEPRSVETCKKIEKMINSGYKVVIFPEQIKQKDINDMVLNGVSVQDVLMYNISQGLEAKILFTAWKRV